MLEKWGECATTARNLYELMFPEEPIRPYNSLEFPLHTEGTVGIQYKNGVTVVRNAEFPGMSEQEFEEADTNYEYFLKIIDEVESPVELVDKKYNEDVKSVVFNFRVFADDGLVIGEGHVEYDVVKSLFD